MLALNLLLLVIDRIKSQQELYIHDDQDTYLLLRLMCLLEKVLLSVGRHSRKES